MVQNNVIKVDNARPHILLLAISGAASDHDVSDAVVHNNTTQENNSSHLEIVEEGASVVSNLSAVGNRFDPSSGSSRFIMPRGRAHFVQRVGNSSLDTEIVTFADGDTTPSVAYGSGFFNTANTGATSITDFDGGSAGGEEITVKIDANTTIVHNSSLIRLKGSVNIVGTSANEIVTLRNFAGIWFETSRNF